MKYFLIAVFVSASLLCRGQRLLINGNKHTTAGSTVTIASSDIKFQTGTSTHSLTSVPASALLVLTIAAETSGNNAIIGGSPTLTWTKQADASAANSGDCEIWTANSGAGGTITITAQLAATKQSSVVYVMTGQNGTPFGTGVTATAQTTASRTVTTTLSSSVILCVSSDFAATTGALTLRDAATLIKDDLQSGAYRGFHYWKQASTVTTYTEGYSAPTSGSNVGTCALEVK